MEETCKNDERPEEGEGELSVHRPSQEMRMKGMCESCEGEDGGFSHSSGAVKLVVLARMLSEFNKERTRNDCVVGGIGRGSEGRELSRSRGEETGRVPKG